MIREKKRYLLIKIDGQFLSESNAKKAVYNSILEFAGELGASSAAPKAVLFDEKKQELVLKTNLIALEQTIVSLAFKTSFEGKPIALRLKKISGTIKGLDWKK
ncbi:hypothetical protein HY993_00940 [Candidatus Micrarchaeota archaeon]|nr:hypothetical protein [Candidatus Micrarchaeota archaeon]